MKKLFLLLFVFPLLIACSSDDKEDDVDIKKLDGSIYGSWCLEDGTGNLLVETYARDGTYTRHTKSNSEAVYRATFTIEGNMLFFRKDGGLASEEHFAIRQVEDRYKLYKQRVLANGVVLPTEQVYYKMTQKETDGLKLKFK